MRKTQDYFRLPLLLLGVASLLASVKWKRKTRKNYFREPTDIKAGKKIKNSEAKILTERYRRFNGGEIHANYCNKAVIQEIFNQQNSIAVGIRIYQALSKDNDRGIVIVGVDNQGNDLADKKGKGELEKFITVESYDKCPPNCDLDNSVLNE